MYDHNDNVQHIYVHTYTARINTKALLIYIPNSVQICTLEYL